MSNDWALQSFQALREEHFAELCRKLNLSVEALQVDQGFAIVSAAAGNVRVFFEHDRGLCLFGLGAFTDAKALCSVEEMAERFPRIRLVSEGRQRLTLEEQRHLVEAHWAALQVMFSPEHLSETRKWRESAVRETTPGFSRGS